MPIMAVLLDKQGSIGCFEHTVSCQIRGQSAGTPLFRLLHRKIAKSLGNGHIRHQQNGQLAEELRLSPAPQTLPRSTPPPPEGRNGGRQSGSEKKAQKAEGAKTRPPLVGMETSCLLQQAVLLMGQLDKYPCGGADIPPVLLQASVAKPRQRVTHGCKSQNLHSGDGSSRKNEESCDPN